jgi:hypothetical protein
MNQISSIPLEMVMIRYMLKRMSLVWVALLRDRLSKRYSAPRWDLVAALRQWIRFLVQDQTFSGLVVMFQTRLQAACLPLVM